MSTRRPVFVVLLLVAVLLTVLPVGGSIGAPARTQPVLTFHNYCQSVWLTAVGEDLSDWWIEVDSGAGPASRYPLEWYGVELGWGLASNGIALDFSLYDGDMLVDDLAEHDGTYVDPSGCDGPDPEWSVEVESTCNEVSLHYEMSAPYPPTYRAWLDGYDQVLYPNGEVPFPSWPSGKFVFDDAGRYRDYTTGLLYWGEGEPYLIADSTLHLTAVKPAYCMEMPTVAVTNTCDGVVLAATGPNQTELFVSGDDGKDVFRYSLAGDLPTTVAFGTWDFALGNSFGSIVNPLAALDGTYVRAASCDAQSDPFSDDDDSVFEADIEWMAAEGITKGCNPPVNDRFCPDSVVTRGQMAAFLTRALGLTERLDDPFIDDDDSVFEADIEKLAAAGITKGCNPPVNDRFCPDGKVTREVMAAFLVRALGYTDSGGGDLFVDDDDSIFEADIDRLGTAGVTKGCNPPVNDRYCPKGNVTRGQMAAFLHRALG